MRAIAIFWVFILHLLNGLGRESFGYFDICFATNGLLYMAISWTRAGALGVDIFFVLSGFLIAYILMKEHKKYGSIDVISFFRGRFIRIWFVIAVYAPLQMIFTKYYVEPEVATPALERLVTAEIVTQEAGGAILLKEYAWATLIKDMVAKLTFTANLVWTKTALWSVAVEFQMYSLSPWIISCMCENPYKVPLLLFFATIVITFAINTVVCPRMLCTAYVSSAPEECAHLACGDKFNAVYTQTYTRAGPYFLGMIAAYWQMNPKA